MSPNPAMQTPVLATAEATQALLAEAAQVAPPATVETATTRMFTEDQLEAARRQEKDKLYPKLNQLEEKLSLFEQERAEAQAQRQAAADAEAAAIRDREQAEMSAKELLKVKEDEWKATFNTAQQDWEVKFNALQAESEARQALLDREREFQELQSYKNRRLAEEQENIMPDLVEFVNGNTAEEIESAITAVVAKTSAIVQNIQQAMPQPPQRLRSISPVGSTPNGPLENTTEQRVMTQEDIKSLSMAEYAQMRDRLLSPTARGGR